MMATKIKNDYIVLIVDDSPDTLGMLNDALESQNMTTLVALDGSQAIKIAQKMRPDIILLDAIMPNMDGFETCKILKENSDIRDIPVIFMTGLTDTQSIVKGFSVGSVDYLTKPINPQELIARINTHLSIARNALSAQTALDIAGNNLFSVDDNGNELWSTPLVNQLIISIEKAGLIDKFNVELRTWLTHKPNIGSKIHFDLDGNKLAALYFGVSSNGEILIRLLDENANNNTLILKETFNITNRESDVFFWLAKGKTNREIAMILEMSPRTVNKHLEQLFKKLDVDNRTSAASKAIECLQNKGTWHS